VADQVFEREPENGFRLWLTLEFWQQEVDRFWSRESFPGMLRRTQWWIAFARFAEAVPSMAVRADGGSGALGPPSLDGQEFWVAEV